MKNSARVSVRLRPRGRGDALLGFEDGVLRARVSAPPVDDRANRALCRLIAARVGVAPSRVRIVHGAKSRDKVVEVESVGADELTERLGG
ncbi:MAG TPA: DUF167 domain-containing protein [Solirubrobacterales bacterium]|nr:DUF167 domain-containing protein [Solirubrobacterales bacterium]